MNKPGLRLRGPGFFLGMVIGPEFD